MIALKAIAIDDSNLSSSSIAEPDPLTGEIEWAKKGYSRSTVHTAHRFCFCEENRVFYLVENESTDVHIYDEGFNYSGVSFSTLSENNDIAGITANDGMIYIIGVNYNVHQYDESGSFTGTQFQAPNSNGRVPISFGNDGFQLITSFAQDVGGTSINFMSFEGVALEPYGMVIDTTCNIVGIEKSDRGLYLLDDDTSTGFRRMLNVDTSSDTDEDMIITLIASYSLTLNDFVGFGDVFYTGNLVIGVSQIDADCLPLKGHPSGSIAVISSLHKKYQSITLNQTAPSVGVNLSVPNWIEVSNTNKYKAFDESISSQSESELSQVIEITPGSVVGGVSCFNVTGATSVNVTMTDPTDGEVYNKDVSMFDKAGVISWSTYWFSPISLVSEFIVSDLPSYKGATLKLTFTGGATIGVGAIVTGPVIYIGVANYGSSIKEIDYSTYTEDGFGGVSVTKKPVAKLVNFDVTITEANIPYVYTQLLALSGVATVWAGDESDTKPLTLVYGLKREITYNIESWSANSVPIQVRGLT